MYIITSKERSISIPHDMSQLPAEKNTAFDHTRINKANKNQNKQISNIKLTATKNLVFSILCARYPKKKTEGKKNAGYLEGVKTQSYSMSVQKVQWDTQRLLESA